MFNALPLDIKVIIASITERAWWQLYLYDAEFANYARSASGARKYAALFHERYTLGGKTTTRLFNRKESIYIPDFHENREYAIQPAVILRDGERRWLHRGCLHRVDGPALITAAGRQEWYWNGRLHRADGPAVWHGDCEEWWHHGKQHRGGGLPALRSDNGFEQWIVNGKLHREGDLPATISGDYCAWYINGLLYARPNDQPSMVSNNKRWWYKNNVLHRDNGPAIIKHNEESWYWSGQLHRGDGKPAVTHSDGRREWWWRGKRRDDYFNPIRRVSKYSAL